MRAKVNGEERDMACHPMARLLDVLRDEGFTGTKEGCGEGECGACSVFVDGVLVDSCLVPAAQCEGTHIETIESQSLEVRKVQDAFLQCGGAQCGICTPGMILASVDLLRRCPKPTEAQIREGLAGNLCRCTGYMKIIDSVKEAAK